MKTLFEMDLKDYEENGSRFERPSVRGIIFKDDKIALVHSKKYDYYKFPGGGCKKGENLVETLIREVQEETGLVVIPSSYAQLWKKISASLLVVLIDSYSVNSCNFFCMKEAILLDELIYLTH